MQIGTAVTMATTKKSTGLRPAASSALPSRNCGCCGILNTRAVFKGVVTGSTPTFLTLFQHISAVAVVNIVTTLSRSICVYFVPKAFCDTQNVLKLGLRPRFRPDPEELTTLPQTPSWLGRRTPCPQSPPLRCLWRLDIGASFQWILPIFFCIRPC